MNVISARDGELSPTIVVLLHKINLARGSLHEPLIDVNTEAGERVEERVFYAGQRTTSKSEGLADGKTQASLTDALSRHKAKESTMEAYFHLSLEQKWRKLDEEVKRGF
jgi:hypothetical protein